MDEVDTTQVVGNALGDVEDIELPVHTPAKNDTPTGVLFVPDTFKPGDRLNIQVVKVVEDTYNDLARRRT
ncbi:MAG: hypothetical protein QOI01_1010 [Mycobacterium sp.]|jgi:hypothetical protein|nr:hypothetical protein [Mycobacterium sp.]